MFDPVCGPRAFDIVANYIFRIGRVLSKDKLNKEINTIIISRLHFLLLSLLLLSAHVAKDSSSATMLIM
jgi:hypothetical protein